MDNEWWVSTKLQMNAGDNEQQWQQEWQEQQQQEQQ